LVEVFIGLVLQVHYFEDQMLHGTPISV
jgi:hypothetical protein